MITEIVEAMVLGGAVERQSDIGWALAAGKAVIEGRGEGMQVEAGVVGGEVLVTVYAPHLGRPRRNWAQARVKAWDGEEDWDTFVKRAAGEVIYKLLPKLDTRDRKMRR